VWQNLFRDGSVQGKTYIGNTFEEDGTELDPRKAYKYLRIEELNDLYCSPNVLRVIKSRRMRWAGHLARMGEERGVYRVLVGKPGGKETTGET